MKTSIAATASAVVLALFASAGGAQGAVVNFDGPENTRVLTFADGTFSQDLSGGVRPDGFYVRSAFRAYNGWGQNGEYIDFNAPVTLEQLTLGRCPTCYNSHPTTFTVSLYDVGLTLLGSQSISGDSIDQLMVFNTANVSRVKFTFQGTDGTNPFPNDTRKVAWYEVSDITYTTGGAVPEPGAWALMIGGFGLAGAALRRRRTVVA